MAASFEARQSVFIRKHNERAWLAWHIGGLSKPLKRYPSLKSLEIKSPALQRQSWEQQLAIAKMWTARNHGKMGKAN